MGTFYTDCTIVNHIDRNKTIYLPKLLVDTGSEYTWIPATELEKVGVTREKKDITFIMANGQKVTRSLGFAIIRIEKYFTIDEVVFAEEGDLLFLGARTLEGLNLVVDSVKKKWLHRDHYPRLEMISNKAIQRTLFSIRFDPSPHKDALCRI